MKVELTTHETGIIIGLMDGYKKRFPHDIETAKTCDEIFLKLISSVYDSSKHSERK